MTDLTEDFWSDLLQYIDDGEVIPIVGSALATVTVGDREISLYRHIAERLAERIRVPISDMTEGFTLNDVVCHFLDQKGHKEDIYRHIRTLLKETPIAPSARLFDLASVDGFNLFVSATFDSLLTQAINEVRFQGRQETEDIAYSPSGKAKDLREDGIDRPVVYHLLGKVSAWPDYVVCDEDLLEFLHALRSQSQQPMRLFDELRSKHLLLLGCRFSDWMARFFIRIAKSQRLSQQRPQIEVLVGSELAQDADLVMFLQHYSYCSRVLPGRADTFVMELARRWKERHPNGFHPPGTVLTPESSAELERMEAGAVFMSYAREDLAVVEQIKTTLESAGLDVWFDKSEIRPGHLWEQTIRRNIANCSLFLAIISRSTQQAEGYFRVEWRLAHDRSLRMADDVPFIIPATIDDTSVDSPGVFDAFKSAHWAQLPGGSIAPEFTGHLKQLVREHQRRQ